MKRIAWAPGPVKGFAEEVLKDFGTCPGCGRDLTLPGKKDLTLNLEGQE